MKKNSPLSRVLSLVLVLALIFSLTLPAMAASVKDEGQDVTWTKVDNGSAPGLKPAHEAAEPAEDPPLYADTDNVRVSIVLEKASTIDAGFSTRHIAENASAMSYRASLKAEQASMEKVISAQALNGKELDVVWNLTLAANIISANVKFGEIEAIKAVPGVKDVVIEKVYSPCVASVGGVDPQMATSSAMIGSGAAWADGYTGAGSRIAIIDTGLDTDHQSFATAGYEYSLQKNAEALGMSYEDYVASLNLLTADEVAAKWSQLNFSTRYGNAAGTFFTNKVPFGANYVDYAVEITHDKDSQGEHGSHVAGIASANSYIPAGEGFVPALESVCTQGVAPDAQLLIMKVFGKGGGAYDADYMVAIEDAILLDADVVNLSLGSANAGPSTDDTYQDILDGLAESDTVVSISAGNAGSWADNTSTGYLYSDGGNLDTVGSPGSFTNAFTVASADNDGATGGYLMVEDEQIFYTETSGPNAVFTTIAGEQSFVYFDNPGAAEDGSSLFTSAVKGKIAVCNRGESSFYQKMDAAAKAGAIGCIVVNNQPGVINMALDDATSRIPCVSVLQEVGGLFKSVSEFNGEYYEGTLTVSDGISYVNYNSEYYVLSDFSSMGVPESLELKPEITAPGGSIYSVNGAIAGGKAYELMSGTSMAAPQIAGMTALVAQYIRENGLVEKTGLSARQLAQSLLMSTAVPQIEADSGSYYPVMKQGAGLANVAKAIESGSYVMMNAGSNAGAADGKVKVELGDDPARTGKYSFGFELSNMTDADKTFELSEEFFTQDYFGYEGDIYLDTWTVPVQSYSVFFADGEALNPVAGCDFDGDGYITKNDGQTLLEYVIGNIDSIECADYADIDASGEVNTLDALLFFRQYDVCTVVVPANSSVNITATVELSNMADYDDCGAYVEGYVFAEELVSDEGVIGDSHSIPVFGYYGSWDESSMFDIGSYVEYDYELETRLPYMYYAAGDNAFYYNTYLVNYAGDSTNYYFGGNPLMYDDYYMPERNALNGAAGDKIAKLNFTAIRNAAASRFAITDSEGNVVDESLLGPVDCAFYSDSQAAWMSTNYGLNVGFAPKTLAEGTQLTMALTLAPAYYVAADGSVDWDSLNEACSFSMPVVIDNTAPEIANVELTDEGLLVEASDNQYIAAVAFYDYDGNLLNVYGSDADAEAGDASAYLFELSEDMDKYLVEVYDYAMNLSTYKLNLNPDPDEPISIEISDSEIRLIRGTSYKLTAEVGPWGTPDGTVLWSSSDESVATVNMNGVVTAVGEGECVITAAANADPEQTAECAVTVTVLHYTLNGVLQDTEGVPQTFTWDLANESTWKTGVVIDPYIGSACRLDADNLLVMSSDGNYDTYIVDAESGMTVDSGANVDGFPYWDMAASQLVDGTVYGVYAYYLFPVEDPLAVNAYGYNLKSYLARTGASYFITIESMYTYYDDTYGVELEEFFLLDNAGYMWYADFDENGDLYYLGSYQTTLGSMDLPGYGDFLQTNMVMSDDEYGTIFFSAFDGATNQLYMLEMYTYGRTYIVVATPIGDVGMDVWPAVLTGAAYDYGTVQPNANRVKLADTMSAKTSVLGTAKLEKVDASALANVASGSLNSVVRTSAPKDVEEGSPDVEVEELIAVDLTAIDVNGDPIDTNNGILSFSYDEEALEFVDIDIYADFFAVNGNRFAYVSLDGIKADEPVATVYFKAISYDPEKMDVSVEGEEAGTDKGLVAVGFVEQLPVETELVGYVAPTCTHDGYTGDLYDAEGNLLLAGEIIAATEHPNAYHVDFKAPTCKEEGYTGDVYCPDCEKVIITGKVIEKIAHASFELIGQKDPSCSEEGYTGDLYCTVCGDLVSEGSVIPKSAHMSSELVGYKAPTCDEEGYTGDLYCSDCGALLHTGSVFTKIDHRSFEVRGAKASTCTEQGYTGDTYCVDCDEIVELGEVLPYAAHQYGAWTVLVAPGCKTPGLEECECAVCHAKATRVVAPAGHAADPFNDIAESGYHDYIIEAAGKGYVTGFEDGSFQPDVNVTRAQFITMLWRVAGAPAAENVELYFTDAADIAAAFKMAVAWGVENGIIKGYEDGSFAPKKEINRAQMATFLYRYLKNVVGINFAEDIELVFADADTMCETYQEAVKAIVSVGIMNGVGNGTNFAPYATANRGMAATVLVRLADMSVDPAVTGTVDVSGT